MTSSRGENLSVRPRVRRDSSPTDPARRTDPGFNRVLEHLDPTGS